MADKKYRATVGVSFDAMDNRAFLALNEGDEVPASYAEAHPAMIEQGHIVEVKEDEQGTESEDGGD